MSSEFIQELRSLSEDVELLYNVPRRAVEDHLIELRDSRISMPFRNNGLVVKEPDGEDSSTIRLGSEMAISLALRSLADHFELENKE